MKKMEILRIVFTLLQLGTVLCKDAWEVPNKDLKDIEANIKKTTIVGYDKALMTADEIEAEKTRIEKECNCNVENLASVGAFILTYDKDTNRGLRRSIHLDPAKEIEAEDQIVTIFNEKIPADPGFKVQWSLQDLSNKADINAAEGWNAYMKDSKGGDPNGPSVIVAVIDSGVDYNHPDLKDIMWTNPKEIAGNGKDDDGNGIIDDVHGADITTYTANGNPMDKNGHGTLCAGVIAAKENNDEGIAGVASFAQGKVKIMAVKGLNDNGASTASSLLGSLNYAIKMGAAISSNSWGAPRSSSGGNEITPVLENLWSMILRNNPNHLFVAGAGNDGEHLTDSYRTMPCGLKAPNLLCVGSSSKDNKKSSFSNYGKDYVHVMAPGSDICSTMPGGRYAIMSGTGMACPHVSGLAALVKTMKPELTGQQLRQAIEANVQKKDVYTNIVSTGGIIDMGKTIRASSVEVTCPDKDDLSAILLENNWRTQNEIAAMSEEDKRNTVIVETEKMTGHTRADLVGRNNTGNLGSLTAIANMATLLVKYSIKRSSDVKTMTYQPHLRNSIIGKISQVFSMQPSTLHSKTDHQLLKMFCGQFDSNCEDIEVYCPKYTRWCRTHTFMQNDCKKTCNLC